MRRTCVILIVGAAAALAGCGTSASQEVQAKLQQFAHAVSKHDARTICRQVLAPDLVSRFTEAGLTCQGAMATYFGSVTDPTISISKVRVKGKTAAADVLAGAQGQPSDLETVQLIDTAHGWRLQSLATPR